MRAGRSGKMPTTSVRRRISRLSRSLGLFDQICRQTSRGKAVKASGVEVFGHGGQLVGQGVQDAGELGVLRRGVGLVVDGVHPTKALASPRTDGLASVA